MNLRQLKEIVDILCEQMEKKEMLEHQIPVLFQDEDDLIEISNEAIRIIETSNGKTVIGIDVSSYFEGCKDIDDDEQEWAG